MNRLALVYAYDYLTFKVCSAGKIFSDGHLPLLEQTHVRTTLGTLGWRSAKEAVWRLSKAHGVKMPFTLLV